MDIPNKNITVRKAVKEDCKRMMELVHELAEYERAPKEVTVDVNHFIESGFGKNPVWWAFVAEIKNDVLSGDALSRPSARGKNEKQIIGFALYYIRYSTWKGQRMYLEDLIVTEKMRDKGAGKLLLDKLIEEARAKKFTGIAWQVLEWNEPAIRFYKKNKDVTFDKEWINCVINW